MFKKILLPCDGSKHSLEAARVAAEIASQHGGTVYPLVAVEYQYADSPELSEEVRSAIHERIQERAGKALQDATGALQAAGTPPTEGKVVEGPAAEAILKEAEDGEYDLIVMGSRGVSLDNGYDRLIGSVTERVLHRALCPVLVIRHNAKPK
jgi:nucleotide-binding universal stress UspA family protein